MSVLDLGCGVGDLGLAMLSRGADRLSGIDLGPGAIEQARALAAERRLEDRSSFETGDAAKVRLEPHDVVVLNRVYCCYPDIDALLKNSLPAARRIYAFTTPRSAGFVGVLARAQTTLSNVWYRLREDRFRGFRVYIHDVGDIDRRVRDKGFRPVVSGPRRFLWHLGVYERVS
jgi:predicted RNA methylase